MEEHVRASNEATSAEGRDHPVRQLDPQKARERSFGFETRGPDGEEGEGRDTGNVHKQEKPLLTKYWARTAASQIDAWTGRERIGTDLYKHCECPIVKSERGHKSLPHARNCEGPEKQSLQVY